MLFIGIGMVSTVSAAHTWLLDLHRPLGILILALALVRLAVRLTHRVPRLPVGPSAVVGGPRRTRPITCSTG